MEPEKGMCQFPHYDGGSSNPDTVACVPVTIETAHTTSVAL